MSPEKRAGFPVLVDFKSKLYKRIRCDENIVNTTLVWKNGLGIFEDSVRQHDFM